MRRPLVLLLLLLSNSSNLLLLLLLLSLVGVVVVIVLLSSVLLLLFDKPNDMDDAGERPNRRRDLDLVAGVIAVEEEDLENNAGVS